ncbi:MAG: phosphate transport system permease protein PstA [Rhizobiaceae bacterium MnEN-MB40S]|nr:MAG: phosphate transport system permease protein PstA [Rhizobiaceae bacterium MnEN-MB40S]
MSDSVIDGKTAGPIWKSPEMAARRKKRHAADRRLQLYGIAAITFAIGFLVVLISSLIYTGASAFVQTKAQITVNLTNADVPADDIQGANWRSIVRTAMLDLLPEELPRSEQRDYFAMFTSNAPYLVRDYVVDHPDLRNKEFTFKLPFADPVDQFAKGQISRDTPEDRRRINDKQIGWFDTLQAEGLVSKPFNTALIFNSDSRFPELAGLAGAISGSFWALLVCFLISFPLGISAAIYLEEFAPKNRLTDLIEININNLAAVPSVVFGLLGLAVFLGWFGLPRSAPLVGGMVLSLMTLPTIIIVTRAALRSVPSSIKEAALGIGASKHEAIVHHMLPLSMPTILTGTIIGLAQALGETAPLLLIGMNAFITSPPEGLLSASTALPTQIYIWADSPERGFVSRTSAAILVLLAFLIVMNGLAVFLRSRFERRW